MALPTSRDETCAPSGKVRSALLNALQDFIISLWAGRHGDVVEAVHPSKARTDGTSTYSHANQRIDSGGVSIVHYPLDVRVGDRLKSVAVARYGTGAANITIRLIKMTAAGAASNVESTTEVNPAAAWGTTTFNFADVTVAAGETFAIAVEFGANAMRSGTVHLTKDHPP